MTTQFELQVWCCVNHEAFDLHCTMQMKCIVTHDGDNLVLSQCPNPGTITGTCVNAQLSLWLQWNDVQVPWPKKAKNAQNVKSQFSFGASCKTSKLTLQTPKPSCWFVSKIVTTLWISLKCNSIVFFWCQEGVFCENSSLQFSPNDLLFVTNFQMHWQNKSWFLHAMHCEAWWDEWGLSQLLCTISNAFWCLSWDTRWASVGVTDWVFVMHFSQDNWDIARHPNKVLEECAAHAIGPVSVSGEFLLCDLFWMHIASGFKCKCSLIAIKSCKECVIFWGGGIIPCEHFAQKRSCLVKHHWFWKCGTHMGTTWISEFQKRCWNISSEFQMWTEVSWQFKFMLSTTWNSPLCSLHCTVNHHPVVWVSDSVEMFQSASEIAFRQKLNQKNAGEFNCCGKHMHPLTFCTNCRLEGALHGTKNGTEFHMMWNWAHWISHSCKTQSEDWWHFECVMWNWLHWIWHDVKFRCSNVLLVDSCGHHNGNFLRHPQTHTWAESWECALSNWTHCKNARTM